MSAWAGDSIPPASRATIRIPIGWRSFPPARIGGTTQTIRAKLELVKTLTTIPYDTPRISLWGIRGTPPYPVLPFPGRTRFRLGLDPSRRRGAGRGRRALEHRRLHRRAQRNHVFHQQRGGHQQLVVQDPPDGSGQQSGYAGYGPPGRAYGTDRRGHQRNPRTYLHRPRHHGAQRRALRRDLEIETHLRTQPGERRGLVRFRYRAQGRGGFHRVPCATR